MGDGMKINIEDLVKGANKQVRIKPMTEFPSIREAVDEFLLPRLADAKRKRRAKSKKKTRKAS